jgi:hypothetical protein
MSGEVSACRSNSPPEPLRKSEGHKLAQTNGAIFSRLGEAARANDLPVIYHVRTGIKVDEIKY